MRTQRGSNRFKRAVDFYGGTETVRSYLDFAGDALEAGLAVLGFARTAEGWRWLAAGRVIPAYIAYLNSLAILRGDGISGHGDGDAICENYSDATVATMSCLGVDASGAKVDDKQCHNSLGNPC